MFAFISRHAGFFGITAISCTGITSHFVISSDSKESFYLLREVSGDVNGDNYSEILDNKKYEDLSIVKHEYYKLVNGDKSYNQGNYIIYYGSESCSHCMGFLYGNQNIDSGNKFSERDKMSNGAWMKAYEYTKIDKDLKNKNIKFLMYEDIPDEKLSSKERIYWNLPWATWNKDNPELGRWKGKYIRNDKSAIEFRKLFESAQGRFGERVLGTPTVIVYKEGSPKVFNQDLLPEFEYKKQGEDMSDDLQLKQFIKYYYTNTKIKES